MHAQPATLNNYSGELNMHLAKHTPRSDIPTNNMHAQFPHYTGLVVVPWAGRGQVTPYCSLH